MRYPDHLPPNLPEAVPEPKPTSRPWDSFALQCAIVGVYGLSAGISIGAGMWLWSRFGADIQHVYWAALALWF